MINVEGLNVKYDNKEILSNISFSINKGEYVAILGENGSGKTTLLKAILGLLPYEGKVEFNGLNKNQIGYLPQQTDLQRDFPATVWEIIMSGFLSKLKYRPFYNKQEKDKALDIIKTLNLESFKDSCYRELSGGQQQRVLLARALCANDGLLVMDEPTSALDAKMAKEFYELIDDIRKNTDATIIIVSHDVEGITERASRVIYIEVNKIVFDESVNHFKCCPYCHKLIGGIKR